jgi:hypothetical protein
VASSPTTTNGSIGAAAGVVAAGLAAPHPFGMNPTTTTKAAGQPLILFLCFMIYLDNFL